MAAYAALVSVMQIINQIESHPRPPISLHRNQIESLTQSITLLQEFLEHYSSHGGYTEEEDIWEIRIAKAAYSAEDVIESHIVDQILARSTNDAENTSSTEFYQGLQKVIEEMNSINIEIKEKMVVQDRMRIIKSVTADAAGSSRSTSGAQKVTMVGFDDVLYQMLDKITGGRPDRQIIPIVGMGGIGKTTLARNIYANPLVRHHFDLCAWSTISQEYNAREILRQVLDHLGKGNTGDLSEEELGEQLYKYLFGRRYFIVMDDMWDIKAWDGVRNFFPNNDNGSRIVVTTRLANLASNFNYSNGLDMKFLDEATSWNLFSKTVFGEQICPLELEDVGKKIVKGCKGLPLSIVVIGGLLSKSERTRENWESIQRNLSSVVNMEDNESCLQILYMSYDNLPVCIKPCFLYLGVLPEDDETPISQLIPIWVAEGFVTPFDGKSLEEVAEEYLEELVDRNLLLVEKRNHYGKLKSFKLHDLLRDVCLREAGKMKFLSVLREKSIHDIPQDIYSQRRILSTLWEYPTTLLQSLEAAPLVRTWIGDLPKSLSYNFRLLRVSFSDKYFEEESSENYGEFLLRLVNLRFFVVDTDEHLSRIPSAISSLWNLQTLVLYNMGFDYIFEFWKMPQLRHVMTYEGTLDAAYGLNGDMNGQDGVFVLENLQSLFVMSNLNFGEGVVRRIPNIKRLKLYYNKTSTKGCDYCLSNLQYLHKLEVLGFRYSNNFHKYLDSELIFPSSLKKLTLEKTMLHWEDMEITIGSLPHLQVLKLKMDSFVGIEWETFEGQFRSLKFLLIESCDIERWMTDKTHFPRLEHLVLRKLFWFREIPLSIGDILTLQSIELEDCRATVVDSAQRIVDEQEELGNEGLQLRVQKNL
ncbi:putative late blight resistance protein homolog R1A-10 [Salvia hispanica]|uniref:putative late blight resistance protein homolog R1A-10 n=1 Tax=Salvia hispanica TaxID=49212 RepID=UPI0020095F6B|nr:putative late blight resistance protein homolog R1A-10 [Salvia hispanica]